MFNDQCMYPTKDYHQFTDYHLEPAGLRRLDFFVRAIEEWIKEHPNVTPKILDVGCGNGNIALPLASRGWLVEGIDMDAQSIADAREKNTFATATFTVTDGKHLPMKSQYDVVVASELIEHMPDPGAFLKEVYDRLTPGGILVGSVPFGYSVEELFRRFFQRTAFGRYAKKSLRKRILRHEIVQSHAESPHLHFFTWKRLERLLHASRFTLHDRANTSIMFKEFFYLFGRLFMTRGSRTFQMLDTFDNTLAEYLPLWMGDGWMFVARKL